LIATVTPGTVEGSVKAPPSKSLTHRAYICSGLANGESTILNPLLSDDTEATRNILKAIGVKFQDIPDGVKVTGGSLTEPEAPLFCKDSGTTLRLMTPICGLIDGTIELTAGESLSKRPVGPLLNGLIQMGVQCKSDSGYPPVTVHGSGMINGGTVHIPGDISSQFISALLLVAPFTVEPMLLELTTPLESKPYVQMTMDVQRVYGVKVKSSGFNKFKVHQGEYKPASYKVEGDWSSAAFLLASGVLAGEVTVGNLELDSSQADAAILDILERMDADLKTCDNLVIASKSSLQPLSYNISDSPDLFPMVSALCAVADGESVISGVRRLQYKESNRTEAMREGLQQMGVMVQYSGDEYRIKGCVPKGVTINPRNDHRIAMAFAVLGLVSIGETRILDAECVSKSYPGFWEEMRLLNTDIKEETD
jgi:3-phosphoshikimate 1-carboxyvinyltransferase